MSEADKYFELARKILHEARKYDSGSAKRHENVKDTKKWWHLQNAAAKRFVRKVMKIYEEAE